jgi:hypothetical protein
MDKIKEWIESNSSGGSNTFSGVVVRSRTDAGTLILWPRISTPSLLERL